MRRNERGRSGSRPQASEVRMELENSWIVGLKLTAGVSPEID